MPKFKCVNPECLFFDQEKIEGRATYFVRDGIIKTFEAICPHCNSEREEVIEKKVFEVPTYEAVGINSNRRAWSKTTNEGKTFY